MKKVILNLAVIGLVAGIAIGGTMAYFSDTVTVDGNTISAGTVELGDKNNFPFQFDNLAPGQETADWDDAETYYVEYDGSIDDVDLYVAFEYEDHSGADLRDILEIALRGRSDQDGSWDWTGENTGWQDANSLFEGWTKVASGLNSGDEAGFRMKIKALPDVPGVIYNDYQGAELMSNVVFYVVQSDGDAPDFGSVETIRGDDVHPRDDISHALYHANEGDIIKVGPGVYEEDLTIDTDNVTLYSEAMATVKSDSSTVVEITANNVSFRGFVVDNANEGLDQDYKDDRGIRIDDSTSGTVIKDNKFINSFRGVQGNWSSGGDDITIIGNTFETAHGVAGTEDMKGLFIVDNTFNTSVEGIGLGDGVEVLDRDGNILSSDDDASYLRSENVFDDYSGYKVKDYR